MVTQRNRRGVEAEVRIAAILAAARKLFAERGYTHTSLNDVIARSGGSKATILKYFGSKAGLFSAVIDLASSKLVLGAQFADLKGTPEQVLRRFGRLALTLYLRKDSLVTYRGVVAEGHRHAGMAKAFYERGYGHVKKALAGQLRTWARQGLVKSVDHDDDADLFLHMIRAGAYEQVLIGIRPSASVEDFGSRVDRAVRIYLRGIA